ncbi:ThiF family adenylyltransferase (plasmid) [Micrococcus luteus]|uniref:ThiF family adenylyltransferase n=1 Tax=Micrococcus luteus TaxID=1270 RepID=UPI00210395C0|nr:ThiF family adenylyltransferase [Micrococcus luteus]UTX35909.1 ThiF family adenylyltransferase [Micrococcus luteus]
MSASRLVRNSPDLQRLLAEGYSVRIVENLLVVDDIPYVDASRQVQSGSFICALDVAGERTAKPENHVMAFVGDPPRDQNGQEISPGFADPGLTGGWAAGPELTPSVGFSQKPRPDGYTDYYEKVTTYAAILLGPARALDDSASPQLSKPVTTQDEDDVFCYMDTFSSRAGITERNQKLTVPKVVIIGLGGTGSYILDLLAKTPIQAIHLYDADAFLTHNAFRAPGAAALEDLRATPKKVDYYAKVYGRMRGGIHSHPINVTGANVHELTDASFVFLAMDTSPDKQVIIETLIARQVPFVDTGIGVQNDPAGIGGQIRITTSLPGRTAHITDGGLISTVAGEAAEYATNLQVAELNMMAAVLAVVRFKKWLGFYADTDAELHSTYWISANEMLNTHPLTAVSQQEDAE